MQLKLKQNKMSARVKDYNNDDEKEKHITNVMYPAEHSKEMYKYYVQRHQLFSKFDNGILLDKESWYSVTPEVIAIHHATRFKRLFGDKHAVILDAFCGAGGNLIQFAKISPNVIVIGCDINASRLEIAKNNARVYGVEHQCQFIHGDFLNIIKTLKCSKIDAIFLSPPWGGVDYQKSRRYSLNFMTPNGFKLIEECRKHLIPNIAFLMPRNIDEQELHNALSSEHPVLEFEKNMIGPNKKVKTVTIYFGDLIDDV